MMDGGGAARGVGGEERRYVHLAPETVTNVAEAIGITSLSAGVAKDLAEDTTYRLREIADACSQFLRHSRKRKLTTDILNKVFKHKNIEPVIGHKKSRILGCDSFEYLPEGELFVESDREIHLVNESLQPVNNKGIEESQIIVSASWIALQGVALSTTQEEGKVNPTETSIKTSLLQYYTTATNHLLGDSEQLCLLVLQDLRENNRVTPLLPYLVTFSRVCLNRYKENSVITARLIRLISALFSNPHINLSPKPYLSYLVSALLGFLIKENKDLNPVEHVQLAACVLSQALYRWATPTNLLRTQTLKALKENSSNHLSYAQYGSLYSLFILGPQVLEECLMPLYETLLSNLWTSLAQEQQRSCARNGSTSGGGHQLGNWSLGLLRLIGAKVVSHWRKRRADYRAAKNLYKLLDVYFGDSLVPFIFPTGGSDRTDAGRSRRLAPTAGQGHGRLRIRKVRTMPTTLGSGGPRHEAVGGGGAGGTGAGGNGDLFGAPRHLDRGFFSAHEDFNFLADMGVPSDIFETADLDATERQEHDFSGYFKSRTVNLSKSATMMFPEAKPFRFRARAVKFNLGPCRQEDPDKLKRSVLAAERGRRMVAWRHLVAGGRARQTKGATRRPSGIANYCHLISFNL